MICCEIGDH